MFIVIVGCAATMVPDRIPDGNDMVTILLSDILYAMGTEDTIAPAVVMKPFPGFCGDPVTYARVFTYRLAQGLPPIFNRSPNDILDLPLSTYRLTFLYGFKKVKESFLR